MNHPNNPTSEFYNFLQQAFNHFNEQLFAKKLPDCMLTTQRQKSVMGYFSSNRWKNPNGQIAHEIALNPSYFANHKLIEVLQTLVHEQCHLWQFTYGKYKSRTGYHNKEWAEKMHSIGLIPSHNGLPGGKQTGQTMSDYPEKNGKFVSSCLEFLKTENHLRWIDTEPAFDVSCQPRNIEQQHIIEINDTINEETISNLQLLACPIKVEIPESKVEEVIRGREQKRKSKTRYTCPNCSTNVWGKPELNIICGDCRSQFSEFKQ